jgi:hypothetical protein
MPSLPTKRLAIIGSTGSIGRSALDVVRQHRDRLEVVALAAGSNAALLAEQAREFHPRHVALMDDRAAQTLAASAITKPNRRKRIRGDRIFRLPWSVLTFRPIRLSFVAFPRFLPPKTVEPQRTVNLKPAEAGRPPFQLWMVYVLISILNGVSTTSGVIV